MKIVILVSILSLISCTASPPSKISGQSVVVEGGGFLIDGSTVKYAMNYRLVDGSRTGVVARVTFENPDPDSIPLVTEIPLASGTTTFIAQSAAIHCISNNRNYTATLELIQDGAIVEEIAQPVLFRISDSILAQREIEPC